MFGSLLSFLTTLLTPKHVKPRTQKSATAPVQRAPPEVLASPPAPSDWARPPGMAYPAPLPKITSETDIDPQKPPPPPGSDPISQVLGLAGPVGTILAAPIKIGELLGNVFGLSQGSISDFNPWLSPNDQPLFHEAIVEVIATQAAMYDPDTGRFLNADGTVGIVSVPYTDKTGQIVALTGQNSREMWRIWKLRRAAAIRFNFDQSKVEADGYTPVVQPPPPYQIQQPWIMYAPGVYADSHGGIHSSPGFDIVGSVLPQSALALAPPTTNGIPLEPPQTAAQALPTTTQLKTTVSTLTGGLLRTAIP